MRTGDFRSSHGADCWGCTAVLAGVGLIGFKEGWDQERIEDRVYRLQHNAGQKRTDNFAVGGLLGGSILTFLLGTLVQPELVTPPPRALVK